MDSSGFPRIFDTHVHFPRNWQNPDEDPAPLLAYTVERMRETGIVKAAVLSGGGRWGSSHEECMRMLERHPDILLPVAVVDPERTTRRRIWELYQMGYRGLKMIGVKRAYDTPDYFPVYAAAEALDMPIVLHLGVIGGGIDYAITHPRRDPRAAQMLQNNRGWTVRDHSALRMHPFHLDTIANNFPALKLIGAHMGGTGNYDAASSVARWRHNVFFDLSGGETIERHCVERRLIGHEIGVEKLTFGSDCRPDEIGTHVQRFARIFEDLGLSEDEKERIWYRNAAEIYGLETPSYAAE